MLPGMFNPMIGTTSQAPVTSLSFLGYETLTGTYTPINPVAGTQAGDILLMSAYGINTAGGPPAEVIASGFTSIMTHTLVNSRISHAYKIVTGGEAALDYINGTTGQRVYLATFRPNSPASAVSINDLDMQYTDVNPSEQTITSGSGIVPLIVIANFGTQSGSLTSQSFSPTQDGTLTDSGLFQLYYKIYNSSPANVTADIGDEGTRNSVVSFYMQVS